MITNFKFGITERGDAGLDLSWTKRLNAVVGAIIISKSDSPELRDALLKHQDKCIYHATCTGLGGTLFEPNAPTYEKKLAHIYDLIMRGFPRKQIVIRIDPLIPITWVPTIEKNLNIDYIPTLKNILQFAQENEIETIRYSYLDLYDHNIVRLAKLPFKFNSYGKLTKNEIRLEEINPNLKYESCAETFVNPSHKVGCISRNDLVRLGIEHMYRFTGSSHQRIECLCPCQKLELLNRNYQCDYKCVYCYWKDKNDRKD